MTHQVNDLCAIPDCYAVQRHLKSCQDQACPGCIPGRAMDGLRICEAHRDMGVRALKAMPRIDSDLLVAYDPHTSPQAPKPEGGRSDERRDAIRAAAFGADDDHPGPFDARRAINEWLSVTCHYVLSKQHPEGNRAGFVGRWDVPSMVRFLLRQADWMSANPVLAPEWALRMDQVTYLARGVLARSRVTGTYLGACPMTRSEDGEQVICGGPIRDRREPGEERSVTIACPWCKHEDTAWWWSQKINPISRKLVRATALGAASYLSQKYLLDLTVRQTAITQSTIRNWAWRPVPGMHRDGCTDEDCRGCRPAIEATACHVNSKRLLYDVAEVEAHARKVYKLVDHDIQEPIAS